MAQHAAVCLLLLWLLLLHQATLAGMACAATTLLLLTHCSCASAQTAGVLLYSCKAVQDAVA
jgi:hypothetical protein